MAINFPTGQTLNQIYTYGGYSWQWNGDYWQVYPQPPISDSFVTGFTLSDNLVNLTQNRADIYSAFTISLSAYTGNTSISGDYLPLSGGTVTGGTIFQSGLTANTFYSSGQVGVGTSSPNAAAIIEIASTTQGVLFPRMTKVQRDLISNPPVGLILFVTDDTEGLYIYKTSGWVQII